MDWDGSGEWGSGGGGRLLAQWRTRVIVIVVGVEWGRGLRERLSYGTVLGQVSSTLYLSVYIYHGTVYSLIATFALPSFTPHHQPPLPFLQFLHSFLPGKRGDV